eukprot:293834-Rhodomonas_salina.1
MKEGVECSLEGRGTEQTYFERQNACLELREGCCSASVELGLGALLRPELVACVPNTTQLALTARCPVLTERISRWYDVRFASTTKSVAAKKSKKRRSSLPDRSAAGGKVGDCGWGWDWAELVVSCADSGRAQAYQMSSFAESKAKKLTDTEREAFVTYNINKLSRIYPGTWHLHSMMCFLQGNSSGVMPVIYMAHASSRWPSRQLLKYGGPQAPRHLVECGLPTCGSELPNRVRESDLSILFKVHLLSSLGLSENFGRSQGGIVRDCRGRVGLECEARQELLLATERCDDSLQALRMTMAIGITMCGIRATDLTCIPHNVGASALPLGCRMYGSEVAGLNGCVRDLGMSLNYG